MNPVSGHTVLCTDNDPKYYMFAFYKMNSDSIIERKEKENILRADLSQSLIQHKTHLVEMPDKQCVYCIYAFLHLLQHLYKRNRTLFLCISTLFVIFALTYSYILLYTK